MTKTIQKVMAGLNDSKSTIKGFLILLIFLAPHICWPQKRDVKEQGFLKSKTYQTSLDYHKRDEKILADKRFFMRIGEEAFLYDNTYDVFAVYLFLPLKGKIVDIYVLKSKGQVATISHKEFQADQFYYYSDKQKELTVPQNFSTHLRFISNTEVASFKSLIASTIVKKRDKKEISDYNSPLKTLWYFNGSRYSLSTDYYIGAANMERIKTLFISMLNK